MLSMCITLKGDLEQIRRDYRGLEIKKKDMRDQVVFPSILQQKGQVSGRSGYTL